MAFVSEALTPAGELHNGSGPSFGEPSLPGSFRWRDEVLHVATVTRTWRSTKDDRGDTYLKRHWYEVELADARRAVIYFDRAAKRGAAHWWLYTIESVSG